MGLRPMRDLPASLDLLALARELLLDELAPLLPPERRRDAHLIATAMAIVAREARGEGWQREIVRLVSELYGKPIDAEEPEIAPTPTLPRLRGRGHPQPARTAPSPASGGGLGWGFGGGGLVPNLLHRFAADLRNGAFETSPSRAAAARAILWRLTIEKLREGNPHFLAANGLSDATTIGRFQLPRRGNSDSTSPGPDPDPQPIGNP